MLDDRFLASPSLALEKARETVIYMGNLAQENYNRAVQLLSKYDEKILEQFLEDESALDKLEIALNNYLVKLTDRALTQEESMLVSELLHTASDFERIGDYADNLRECAQALHQKNITFSGRGHFELDHITSAVREILDLTMRSYTDRSASVAFQVEPLEEVVDLMRDTLHERHVERLKRSECTVELGIQYLEMLINLERISDHCAAVALYVLKESAPADSPIRIDTHNYLHELHRSDNPEYTNALHGFKEKFFAPVAETPEIA